MTTPNETRAEKARRMAALVREAEASSESLAAFARRHGIREQTLYWWRKRVGRSEAAESTCTLLPVKIRESQPRTASTVGLVEIELSNDLLLRVPADMEPTRVAELAFALRRC
jgi:transposase-like protein